MIRQSESASARVDPAKFLSWLVQRNPVGLFDAWWLIPGVRAVVVQDGPWTCPGSHRRLLLTNGSSTSEEVLVCDLPNRFVYRMTGLSSPMTFLVTHVDGEWHCAPSVASSTKLRWTYAFADRGLLARLALRAMIVLLWRGYMRSALTQVVRAAEAEILPGMPTSQDVGSQRQRHNVGNGDLC